MAYGVYRTVVLCSKTYTPKQISSYVSVQNYCFSLGVAWRYNRDRILDPRINTLLHI